MEEKFMKEALKQAKKAASIGETPIGAVIVRDGQIIARGYNKRETKKNAGAIINSRIENLYFGAYDKKSGCAGSVINLFESGMFNHNVNVTGGITEDKCASILTEFFRELRKKKQTVFYIAIYLQM